MTEDRSCGPIAVGEVRAGYLRLAQQEDEKAVVYDDQAQIYEEVGITGIHPSAPSLRASAREAREQAVQLRHSADTLT